MFYFLGTNYGTTAWSNPGSNGQMTFTDPSPVVINNAGKLQYEFVYDGVEWIVTG